MRKNIFVNIRITSSANVRCWDSECDFIYARGSASTTQSGGLTLRVQLLRNGTVLFQSGLVSGQTQVTATSPRAAFTAHTWSARAQATSGMQ